MSVLGRIEGLQGEELLVEVAAILEELRGRVDDLECHQAVPDSSLMLLALDDRLRRLEDLTGQVVRLLDRLAR